MQAIIDFVLELDRLKAVTRKIRLRESGRLENSAEHSWQLALFAFSLRDYVPGGVDVDRVIRMLLVHDLGEIEIGDTMAFVEEGLEQRKRDERAAVTQLFGALPEGDGDELLALWEEFEEAVTAEARFAHAIDRAMPVLHNLANARQSWRENGISFERVVRGFARPSKRDVLRSGSIWSRACTRHSRAGGSARATGPNNRGGKRDRRRHVLAITDQSAAAVIPASPICLGGYAYGSDVR